MQKLDPPLHVSLSIFATRPSFENLHDLKLASAKAQPIWDFWKVV